MIKSETMKREKTERNAGPKQDKKTSSQRFLPEQIDTGECAALLRNDRELCRKMGVPDALPENAAMEFGILYHKIVVQPTEQAMNDLSGLYLAVRKHPGLKAEAGMLYRMLDGYFGTRGKDTESELGRLSKEGADLDLFRREIYSAYEGEFEEAINIISFLPELLEHAEGELRQLAAKARDFTNGAFRLEWSPVVRFHEEI